MKKSLLAVVLLLGASMTFAQTPGKTKSVYPQLDRTKLTAKKFDKKILSGKETGGSLHQPFNPGISGTKKSLMETIIGSTTYDLQSNASCQNRIKRHGDGTITAVWTMSSSGTLAAPDRGTGYNFFDGANWGTAPSARIESEKTGWPSYGTTSDGAEVFICHNIAQALLTMGQRTTIGSGTWNLTAASTDDQVWNRMAIGGSNGKTIHHISCRAPSSLGGSPFNGVDGALLYYRSLDGGANWDIQDLQIPGMDTNNYYAMGGDAYGIDAKGDIISVVYFGDLDDVILAKSYDNGTTWSNTKIIDIPFRYNASSPNTAGWIIGISDVNGDQVADTIESSDGSGWVLLDDNGIAHVFYGVMWYLDDTPGDDQWSYFPGINGVAYWNENFGNNPPIIIGGAMDLNNNGTLDIIDPQTIAAYYLSLASMPSAGIDTAGCIYATFSALVETLDQGTQNYRHIYAVKSCDGGCSWSQAVDITPIDYAECVFGSMAKYVDSTLHIVYQRDYEPGLAVRGDSDPFVTNEIVHVKVSVSNLSSIIAVAMPPQVMVFNTTDNSCAGACDGSATIVVSCGAQPISVSWSNGDTSLSATGLCAGSYDVTVTDGVGNSATESVTINDPGPISVSTSATDLACFNVCNGSATASVNLSCGAPPFTYLWDDPGAQTNSVATGLCAGTYNVTVTDSLGNFIAKPVVVNEPSALSSSTAVTNISCNPYGSINLTVSGGTTPYTVAWYDLSDTSLIGNSEDIDSLTIGSYAALITDAGGCTFGDTASVAQVPVISIDSMATVTDVTCSNDGAINITINNGNLPLTYYWSNGSTSQDLNAISVGNYTVTVSDATGCSDVASYTVNGPSAALSVTLDNVQSSTIYITVTGGTPSYTYAWSNSATVEDPGPLTAGTYGVTVTDANGCTSVLSGISVVGMKEIAFGYSVIINPNPGNGIFLFELTMPEGKGEFTFAVRDIIGKEIMSWEVPVHGKYHRLIDLTSFPQGIYTLGISSNAGNNRTMRLVKY